MKFIDEVKIEIASGKGGPGCVSFRREKFVPRGGPNGGDGGRGGDVIFRTSKRLRSLLDLKIKTKYKAQNGEPGSSNDKTGKDGEPLVLDVPPGTLIKTPEGNILHDLGPDTELTFLKGGQGGKGNTFYKTSVNQAPGVAQKGMPGQTQDIILELKLLADVGIIGFPNAGKSTLISHISAAKPKIADYPFTTLQPNLGVVKYGQEHNFIVADMPGLIKGAHEGTGLGTQFLKHIERTKVFVHLIDATGISGRSPLEDFESINEELVKYDELHLDEDQFQPLAKRPQIVVLNKIDAVAEDDLIALKKQFYDIDEHVYTISAATGQGLKELTYLMGDLVFKNDK